MGIHVRNGKGLEFLVARTILEFSGKYCNITIETQKDYDKYKAYYDDVEENDPKLFKGWQKSQKQLVGLIDELLVNENIGDSILCFMPDNAGEGKNGGDVRDIVLRSNDRELGLSIKNKNDEFKSCRIGKDFTGEYLLGLTDNDFVGNLVNIHARIAEIAKTHREWKYVSKKTKYDLYEETIDYFVELFERNNDIEQANMLTKYILSTKPHYYMRHTGSKWEKPRFTLWKPQTCAMKIKKDTYNSLIVEFCDSTFKFRIKNGSKYTILSALKYSITQIKK